MITIITGPQGSGKTTKAKELTEGKKTVWLTEYHVDNLLAFKDVTDKTQVIVIDEVKSLDIIRMIYSMENLIVEKLGETPNAIPKPPFIIITSELTKDDIPQYQKTHIIEMGKSKSTSNSIQNITVKGELLFKLDNKIQWINRVPKILPAKTRNGKQWVWVDKNGNVFECGADFSAAEKAETYPCKVYRLQSVSAVVNG